MRLFAKCAVQYHCNIHYKDVVKHSNMGQKFSFVLLALSTCILIMPPPLIGGA